MISLAGKELVVEGSAVGQGIEVEMVGQGLADISKGGAPAEGNRDNTRPRDQYRHMFSGVVAARPGGVTAMVGGSHYQISWLELPEEGWQIQVQLLKRLGIPYHITSMSKVHIEVDKVGEDQALGSCLIKRLQGSLKEGLVVISFQDLTDPPMGIDVSHLADRYHPPSTLDQVIEEGG